MKYPPIAKNPLVYSIEGLGRRFNLADWCNLGQSCCTDLRTQVNMNQNQEISAII